ncbi:hypothetical protein HY479_02380 [Candidatus Uhrbacteria bacterium]|nr:hypothetical protein [Candidatus Uhrbacteria bacterium]
MTSTFAARAVLVHALLSGCAFAPPRPPDAAPKPFVECTPTITIAPVPQPESEIPTVRINQADCLAWHPSLESGKLLAVSRAGEFLAIFPIRADRGSYGEARRLIVEHGEPISASFLPPGWMIFCPRPKPIVEPLTPYLF